MDIGDKIRIVDYDRPDDEDLINWANNQDTNLFTVTEIDDKNKLFYIKGCDYAIPFDSIDYKIVN